MTLNREFVEEPAKRELRRLSESELAAVYQYELRETFPASELKPLYTMEQLQRKGRYEPLGLFQGPFLQGYALLWGKRDEEYPLLDYLGVPGDMRGQGMGTEVLRRLKEYCAQAKGIVVESEAPESAADEADRQTRLRRLEFYRRCGFVQMSFDCGLFGVHYKVLVLPLTAQLPEEEEVLEHYRGRFQDYFTPENYERYVQVPLKEGEQVHPFSPWVKQ